MVLTQAEAFHHSQLGELSLSLSGSNSPALPRIASRIWLSWLITGFWRSRHTHTHTHTPSQPESTPGQPWMWGKERLYRVCPGSGCTRGACCGEHRHPGSCGAYCEPGTHGCQSWASMCPSLPALSPVHSAHMGTHPPTPVRW